MTNIWALPVADDLCNNVTAHWAWQEGSTPDGIDSQFLAQWLGHNAGVTLDWACDLLKLYANHHAQPQDMHFSNTAQEAHENLIKRSHKTILVTAEAPHASASTVEHGSTVSNLSGSLAACVMITMDFGISPGCYQVGGVKTLNYSGNSVVR